MLTKKQQKYQHYHQVKLIDMNILKVKKILPSDQSRLENKLRKRLAKLGKLLKN